MSERERLMKRLSSYDFAVIELHIYLDTHPHDQTASRQLEEFESKAAELRDEYEKKFGPITSSDITANRWAWIADPWPWNTSREE